MNKDEIVREFCEIAGRVGREVYKHRHASDCFCGENQVSVQFQGYFQFEPVILDFIRAAVNEKIARDAPGIQAKWDEYMRKLMED